MGEEKEVEGREGKVPTPLPYNEFLATLVMFTLNLSHKYIR